MQTEFLGLLYDAIRAQVGLIVRSDDIKRLRQKLYVAKRSDEALTNLALVPSPTEPNELWIVKRNANGPT